MKCKDFEKLIHLYLDGEADEKSSKELEEHLLICQICSKKLQELKNLETEAKRTKLAEPSPAYWESFTRKVRDKIILRKKKSIWAKMKSGWESIFIYSPSKLRIAAGIASILLVFIIGKLYWDYKGKELERIRTERMEKILTAPSQEKIGYQAPVVKESLHVAESAEEIKLVEPKPSSVEEKVTKTPVPSESIALKSEEKVQDKKAKEEREAKSPELKKSITVTAEKPKIEKGVTANLRTVTEQEMLASSESLKTGSVQFQPVKSQADFLKMKTGKGISLIDGKKYYQVDETLIQVLTENDTSVAEDTLKKIINSWKEFFEKKPESEWALEGFSQLKIGYQLLFLKTGEDSLLKEGIKFLSKLKESAVEQKIKDQISSKIIELEALEKK